MDDTYELSSEQIQAFNDILESAARFHRLFDQPPDIGFLAEIHVAVHFDLKLTYTQNNAGYDALDQDGKHYEIKYRSQSTINCEVNSWDFDFLVLVNLNSNYQVDGMWRMTIEQAKDVAEVKPNKRGQYLIRQKKFKRYGERVV